MMRTINEMRAEAASWIRCQESARKEPSNLEVMCQVIANIWYAAREICERVDELDRPTFSGSAETAFRIDAREGNLDAAARLAGAWSTVYSAAAAKVNEAARIAGVDHSERYEELRKQANEAFAELSKISAVMMYPHTIFKSEETKDGE